METKQLIVLGVVAAATLVLAKRKGGRRTQVLSGSITGDDSLKDGVTALYNKAHLMQRLQEHMARTDREKKVLSLVLWDIDGFSEFNNKFGQKEGDRLLRQVAGSIKKSVRVYDEIFRSGPDEFCAILTPADPDISKEVTRRVGQLVSKELFEAGSEYATHKFSLASGFVFYPESQSTDHSPEALLHAANQALYKSRLAPTPSR